MHNLCRFDSSSNLEVEVTTICQEEFDYRREVESSPALPLHVISAREWYRFLINSGKLIKSEMNTSGKKYTMLVFSQLRWHSVTQRPHHIMRRFASQYNILFIEEPQEPSDVYPSGTARVESVANGLDVLTPFFAWEDWPAMCRNYASLLGNFVKDIGSCIAWFYSPTYVHLLDAFSFRLVVYDCMDELAAFKGASENLPRYEARLLNEAQVVFTGGKSLYEAKRQMHQNVHCFPSSVDEKHFQMASSPTLNVPADLLAIQRPIVGYYGVIDERIDFDLLARVAADLPAVSFVMIGPFAKINPADVSHPSNVYFLGKRTYEELPSYLKGFDVAMMPFAMNESTRFISPTKTLEFMAADKPVISTPVPDVVRDYKDVVLIAATPAEFSNGIELLLRENGQQRSERSSHYRNILARTSWDATVTEMGELMTEALKIGRKSKVA
jgi:glycosyltransferase involved in cell wall biosynthesis